MERFIKLILHLDHPHYELIATSWVLLPQLVAEIAPPVQASRASGATMMGANNDSTHLGGGATTGSWVNVLEQLAVLVRQQRKPAYRDVLFLCVEYMSLPSDPCKCISNYPGYSNLDHE